MVPEDSLLVTLVTLIDRIPLPPPGPPRRGRPVTYPDRLFLKALVIMVLKRLPTVHALLAVLEQPTPEMRRLRVLLTAGDRFPARRTWERRLATIPATLPAQITCLSHELVALLDPWQTRGRAVAIDSTVLRARGGVWHQKDRAAGVVPHTSIDTEAHWTKSGWHGWVYGWKLHLVVTVAGVWIPVRAALTPANTADNEQATDLLTDLPAATRFVLGDRHYQDAALHRQAATAGWTLVASRYGAYPHHDDGVAVRRIFHKERSVAIENFNEQFKAICDIHGPVPTRGQVATARWVLGAILVYQLTLLYRHHVGLSLRTGLKPFLQAA